GLPFRFAFFLLFQASSLLLGGSCVPLGFPCLYRRRKGLLPTREGLAQSFRKGQQVVESCGSQLRREVVTSYADECEAAVRVAVRWEQRHHDGDRRALKVIGVLFEANNRVLFIFVVFFIAS